MLAATAGTALAGLSGCLSIAPFDTPRADDLLASVAVEHDRERAFEATRILRSGRNHAIHERTHHLWRLGPDRVRTETKWSYDESEVGNVRVAREASELEYHDTTGTVRLRGRDRDGLNPAERIADDYRLEHVGTERVGYRDVEVVDAVPTTPAADARSVSVRLGDTEYVVPLESTDDDPTIGEKIRKRLWIDPDLPVFVQERTEVAAAGNERFVDERAHYGISVDHDIDRDRFEFEPPREHVSVVKSVPSERSWRHSSRERLAAEVPFPHPDPTLPEGYALDEGRVMYDGSDDVVGLRLWYVDENRDRRLFVTVATAGLVEPDDHENGRTRVTRDGVEGDAVEAFDVENVEWECDGRTYRVGSHPDRETVLEIAESIDC